MIQLPVLTVPDLNAKEVSSCPHHPKLATGRPRQGKGSLFPSPSQSHTEGSRSLKVSHVGVEGAMLELPHQWKTEKIFSSQS